MKNMRNWILGAAVVAGVLGLGTTTAQAAEYRVHARPAGYVRAYPGPGYGWVNGYCANGVWIGGRGNYIGVRDRGFYGRPHFFGRRHIF